MEVTTLPREMEPTQDEVAWIRLNDFILDEIKADDEEKVAVIRRAEDERRAQDRASETINAIFNRLPAELVLKILGHCAYDVYPRLHLSKTTRMDGTIRAAAEAIFPDRMTVNCPPDLLALTAEAILENSLMCIDPCFRVQDRRNIDVIDPRTHSYLRKIRHLLIEVYHQEHPGEWGGSWPDYLHQAHRNMTFWPQAMPRLVSCCLVVSCDNMDDPRSPKCWQEMLDLPVKIGRWPVRTTGPGGWWVELTALIDSFVTRGPGSQKEVSMMLSTWWRRPDDGPVISVQRLEQESDATSLGRRALLAAVNRGEKEPLVPHISGLQMTLTQRRRDALAKSVIIYVLLRRSGRAELTGPFTLGWP